MTRDGNIRIKTPDEIRLMREAGRVNALALAAVRELLQPGVTTADLNAAAEEILRKHGAYSPFMNYGHPPFPASICVSINEELVHGIPGKTQTAGRRYRLCGLRDGIEWIRRRLGLYRRGGRNLSRWQKG